ncbi:peroxidase-like [Battus philenor]|uniref:peroxidase-like n=1 Tax=Battus philenor TaxID=42288 RepID=UPI0035D07D38
MLPPNHAVNGGPRTSTTGGPLPNARNLRVSLLSDGRVHNNHHTQLITYLLLVMTGDVTSVHDTVNYVVFETTCCTPAGRLNPQCMPIEVPSDDLFLRTSDIRCLNLTRAITYQQLGCASSALPPERINTSPPMLDLSILYGNDVPNAERFRQKTGGLLRSELFKGKDWPPNGGLVCIVNQPPRETYCYDSGNQGLNAILGIQLLGLWFYRNHNQIARQLSRVNPCWGDERLFYAARDINIAYYQHIIYYELMPSILGYEVLLKNQVIFNTYDHINDYDDLQEPRVSIEYVIGTRWFHSLQEGRLQLYDNNGNLLNELPMMDYSLRTAAMRVNNTVEGVTQGSFRQPCAANDLLVDPEVGERILGPLQRATDVSANDIMKGRDVGLPSYNQYRKRCGLPPASSFRDLYKWIPKDQVDVMARRYESVEDVDLMAAILVEYPMRGAVMGPTLACIMIDQLQRWRRADRFWYENPVHPGTFTPEQLYEIRKVTMARIICDNGDSVDAVQPRAFVLPGHGNEIVNCSYIPSPNIEAWREPNCVLANNSDNSTITFANATQET